MCFLGLGCSSSNSSSSNSTINDNRVNDNRVGIDNGTYVGAGAAIDSHDISTVDSHNVQTTDSHNVTQVVDSGLVNAAATIAGAALDNNAIAIRTTGQTSQDAIKMAGAAASAAADAARRTASDAINAVTADAADSRALARTLGVDAIRFASDVSSGFIASSADLNKLVGTLSSNNDKFLTDSTDKILARSQSADQQNFETTINLLKWVAAAIAAALVVPQLVKSVR